MVTSVCMTIPTTMSMAVKDDDHRQASVKLVIDATTKTSHITKSFIGLMILPLTGSFTKSFIIIWNARSEGEAKPGQIRRLDFTVRSVMTNVLDTLLCIMPLLVLVIGQPMILEFGRFG